MVPSSCASACVFLLFFSLFLLSSTSAATFQFNPNTPESTIRSAFSTVQKGDLIEFAPGDYFLTDSLLLVSKKDIKITSSSTTQFATFQPSTSLRYVNKKFGLLKVSNSSSISLSGLLFRGAYYVGDSAGMVQPKTNNNEFMNNAGAALQLQFSENVNLENVQFSNNIAITGGAVMINGCNNVSFVDALFDSNEAFIAEKKIDSTTRLAGVSNVLMRSVYNFMNNPVYAPAVEKDSSTGGAASISNSNGISFEYFQMSNNKAGSGGAVMAYNSKILLKDGKITKSTGYFQASAIYVDVGTVEIDNVDLIGNICIDKRCKSLALSGFIFLSDGVFISLAVALAYGSAYTLLPLTAVLRTIIVFIKHCVENKKKKSQEGNQAKNQEPKQASEIPAATTFTSQPLELQQQKSEEHSANAGADVEVRDVQLATIAEEAKDGKLETPGSAATAAAENITASVFLKEPPVPLFKDTAPLVFQGMLIGYGFWVPNKPAIVFQVICIIATFLLFAMTTIISFFQVYKSKPLLDGMDISRNTLEILIWTGFSFAATILYPLCIITCQKSINTMSTYFGRPEVRSHFTKKITLPLIIFSLLPWLIVVIGIIAVVLTKVTSIQIAEISDLLTAYTVIMVVHYFYIACGMVLTSYYSCQECKFQLQAFFDNALEKLHQGSFALKSVMSDYVIVRKRMEIINKNLVPGIAGILIVTGAMLVITLVSALFGPFADNRGFLDTYKHLIFTLFFLIMAGITFLIFARVSDISRNNHLFLTSKLKKMYLEKKQVNSDEMVIFLQYLDSYHFTFKIFGTSIYTSTIVRLVVAIGTIFSVLQAFSNSYSSLFYTSYSFAN